MVNGFEPIRARVVYCLFHKRRHYTDLCWARYSVHYLGILSGEILERADWRQTSVYSAYEQPTKGHDSKRPF